MWMWVIASLFFAGVLGQNVTDTTQDDDKIRITSVLIEPYLTQVSNGQYEGFLVDLLDELSDRALVKYKLHIVKDGMFGKRNDDGTWTGMVGEVLNNQADVIAAPMTVTSGRERVLDFGKAFLNAGLLAVTSQPVPEIKPDFFLIFKPFTVGVWLLILVCLFVFSGLLFVINQFHPSEWRQALGRGKGTEENATAFGLQGSMWLAYSTLHLQGYEKTPRSLAGRVLLAFWFVFVTFTLVMYISSMVNTLAALNQDPIPPTLPSNLEEHVARGGRVVVLKGGSSEHFFTQSSDSFYKEVASNMIPVSTLAIALAQVRASNGDLALVTDSPTIQYAILQEPCDLRPIGEMLSSGTFALAFRQGDELRMNFDNALSAMQDDNVIANLQKKWWTDRKECDAPSSDEEPAGAAPRITARPVMLNSFSGGIVIFILGILLSSLVAVAEYAYRNQKNKPRKTKEQLLEAEEGQALNETSKTMLDKTQLEDENEKEMQEITKKEDDTGPELEPEDKEEKEEKKKLEQKEAAENTPEAATDTVEEINS